MFLSGWLVLLLWGLLSLTGGISRLQNIDWYQYDPEYFVLKDLNSNQPSTVERAWIELARRDAGGSLSAPSRDKLVRFALSRQGNAKAPYNNLDIRTINYLGNRVAVGDLPQEQRTRFFEQSLRLRLAVRPKVIAGDSVPYLAIHEGLGPSSGFWAKLTMIGGGVDGKPGQSNAGGSSSWGGFGTGSIGSSLECRVPGKHEISLTFGVEIFNGPFNSAGGAPLYRSNRTLTSSFEVLAAKPQNLVQPIFDPKLAGAIKAVIAPESFHFSARNENSFQGNIHFFAAPVNLAFDVYVRYGGKEHQLGAVTCSARNGPLSNDYSVFGKGTPPVPGTVDVILRPSEKAARGTADLYSFWNQELVYPNVPVAQP